MCLRLYCFLSLLSNWFSRSVFIQQVTEFVLWHDRLTWNLAGPGYAQLFTAAIEDNTFHTTDFFKESFSPHWVQMDKSDLKATAYLSKANILCINSTREKLISKQYAIKTTYKILFHPRKGLTFTTTVILKEEWFFQIQNICSEIHRSEGSWSIQWMHIPAVMAMSSAV